MSYKNGWKNKIEAKNTNNAQIDMKNYSNM